MRNAVTHVPTSTHDSDTKMRSLVTPEGVRLNVALASRSERGLAVLLDLFFVLIVISLISFLQFFLFKLADYRTSETVGWGVAVFTVSSFLIRSFYFTFFELRWQGRTPGKKIMGLRVVDRKGGPLTANAVFARNLTREVELFIPINIMLASNFSRGIDQLEVWLSIGWLSVFVLMPLLNKDRLRVGDIIAGTGVVTAPKHYLMSDLAGTVRRKQQAQSQKATTPGPKVTFLPGQLDAYGIYELQTLENLLRKGRPPNDKTYQEVCVRIRKKISWDGGDDGVTAREFLECYYNALRGHLETKLAFGERREDKHHSKTN